jgi:predicted metal-binding protein
MTSVTIADDRPTGPVIITVCTSCRPAGSALDKAPGLLLLDAVRKACVDVDGVQVRPAQCLSVCTRVCSASLSSEGGYTFVYGDLDAAHDASPLVAMAAACRDAVHGFVAWKNRPEALRKGMIARIPPPGWSPADGGTPA